MLGPAIAQLLGWLTLKGRATASPTQTVGPASPEPIQVGGKPYSVAITCHQCQHVNHLVLQSNEVVQSTSAAQKHGSETPFAQPDNQYKVVGTKQVTLAHPIHQPANQVVKVKQEPALLTPLAPLSAFDKAPALTRTDNLYGGNGKHKTLARQTRRHASRVAKAKREAAKQALLDKQLICAKTPVLTRMDSPSSAHGT